MISKVFRYALVSLLLIPNGNVRCSSVFKPEFERINIEDGLPNSTVNCLLNDSHGYIWIGTEDGLARYDSKSFKIYKRNYGTNGPLADAILMLYEDDDSLIWVGTRRSLELYSRELDSFRHFKFFPDANNNVNQAVTSFCKSSDNDYYIGTDGGGLYHLSFKNHNLDSAHLTRLKMPGGCMRISSICLEGEGKIWIGTYSDGLFYLDTKMKSWKHITLVKDNEAEIRTVINSDPQYLYIGTYDKGLCRMNKKTGDLRFYTYDPDKRNSIGSNRIISLFRENDGNIWIGTDGGGLNYYDISTQHFNRYQYKGFDDKSLSNNSVYAVIVDKEGNIWTGNYHGGLNISKGRPDFYSLGSNPGYPNSLDNNGNLWVGTDGNGINIFDKNGVRVEKNILPQALVKSLRSKSVLALLIDSRGWIWIGTYLDGFYQFDPKTGQYNKFISTNNKYPILQNDDVRCLFEDKENRIWAGTNGGGIYIYDPADKSMINIRRDLSKENSLSLDWVRDIMSDSYGFVWIATAFGLNSYDPVKKEFVKYFHDNNDSLSLSDNMVFSVQEASDKTLWIATNNGLDQFDRVTNTFKNYSIDDGLPSNTISSIMEDDSGNIWLATNNGLSMLNTKTQRFTNYNNSEGLISSSFIENSYYKDKNGRFYLGSIEGLVYFHPDSVGKHNIQAPIIITSLSLSNRPVRIGEVVNGRTVLTRDISLTRSIEVSYKKQSVISLEYTALYYRNPSMVRYRYKLEGFDNNWNFDQNGKQSVTYTNLKPGNYKFIVQVLDEENRQKALNSANLAIYVVPPFWMRFWFKMVVLAAIIFIAYSWYLNRLSSWQAQKEELKRKMLQDQLKNEKEQMQLRSEMLKTEFEKQEALMNFKNSQLISFALQMTHRNDIMRKINNRLNQYYKSIKNEEVKLGIIELSKTIDQEFKLQKDWERFEKHFNEVHRDFFKRIKQQYPDLGLTYLKLCAYLKLELSSKEIASLLNISTRGVEKARSRLRKKFDLDRNESLNAFLTKV